MAGAGPVTCPTLAYKLGPAIWRLKAIRAEEVPPLKLLFTASAHTTLASPLRPTVTLKKSSKPRSPPVVHPSPIVQIARSEERRVGKECRSWRRQNHYKKKVTEQA